VPHMQAYANLLDAIGLYLEYKQTGDALINEIEGGFVVGYMEADEQKVTTLSNEDMQTLQAEALRVRRKAWNPAIDAAPTLRDSLLHLGRYLDVLSAGDIVVQERLDGFSVEYTGVPISEAAGLARLYLHIDVARLYQLTP